MILAIKKGLIGFAMLIAAISLSGCSDLSYYLQCAKGEMEIISSARPIAEVINDPQTTPELRLKLEKIQQMRNFAVTELGLPDNGSYRRYADIGRPYVVWNIVATEEFSLQPKQWCFPIAGCLSYKGYFHQAQAEQLAARLQTENYDVDLYGVQAYSTLNWFDDPVLNTFVASSDARLAGLLFHELAHQLIYIDNDSSFNEAFAMTVQIEGVHRWFQQHAKPEEWHLFLEHQRQSAVFQDFLRTTREQLRTLYQQNLPEKQMRSKKQLLLSKAHEHFAELKESRQLGNGFDRWMSRGLNNARLAGIATYRELVPGFQTMLQQCQGNLGCFYERIRVLSKLSKKERREKLKSDSQPQVAVQPDICRPNPNKRLGY